MLRQINRKFKLLTSGQAKENMCKYSNTAGKTKPDTKNLENFEKKEINKLIKKHAQTITDFNLIFENTQEIRLWTIGTLHTTPPRISYNLSNKINYLKENKSQQITFLKKPIQVEHKLHIIKSSKAFFENKEVKDNLENTKEYKRMFNEVMEELKSKGIKVRQAKTEEEYLQTGYNILLNSLTLSKKDDYADTLDVKNT